MADRMDRRPSVELASVCGMTTGRRRPPVCDNNVEILSICWLYYATSFATYQEETFGARVVALPLVALPPRLIFIQAKSKKAAT